jgi:hypothetical protein
VTRTVIALDEFLAGKWGADNGAVTAVALMRAPLPGTTRVISCGMPGGNAPTHDRALDTASAKGS